MSAPGCGTPTTLLRAIGDHALEQPGSVLRSGLLLAYPFLHAVEAGALGYQTWHVMQPVRDLVRRGAADYLPVQASEVLRCLDRWAPDVMLVRTSPPDRHGYVSLGPCGSYVMGAVQRSATVLAEIDPSVPRTYGGNMLHHTAVTAWVDADGPMEPYRRSAPSPASTEIAGHVVDLLPDRPTLQLGIGAVPEAILDALVTMPRASLRFVGMACDGMVELIRREIVDPAGTAPDPAISVAEMMGTETLMRAADGNPLIGVYSSALAHDPAGLAANDRLVSVNSAVEVDLDGNANAESIGTEQIAGVGGSNDFVNAAYWSTGGVRVIALPSTTAKGTSRIVPALGAGAAVTLPRHFVDVVVTEHGIARLSGCTRRQRAERLVAIAHPDHRAALDRSLDDRFAGGGSARRKVSTP